MMSTLGTTIKAIRETKGIDQESLSSAIGCSRVAVSQYESGKREIPTEKVKAIARHLEVDPLELLEIRIKDKIANVISDFRRSR